MLVAYLLGGNVKAIFYHWNLVFYSTDYFFLLILISMIDSLEYFQVCMLPHPKVFTFEEGNLQINLSACPRLLSLSNLHSPISIPLTFMGYTGKLQIAEADLQKKMRLKYDAFTHSLAPS